MILSLYFFVIFSISVNFLKNIRFLPQLNTPPEYPEYSNRAFSLNTCAPRDPPSSSAPHGATIRWGGGCQAYGYHNMTFAWGRAGLFPKICTTIFCGEKHSLNLYHESLTVHVCCRLQIVNRCIHGCNNLILPHVPHMGLSSIPTMVYRQTYHQKSIKTNRSLIAKKLIGSDKKKIGTSNNQGTEIHLG